MDEKTQRLYGFGPFRLDAREYLLLLDGRPVPVPPKAFEALLMLVENAGHLVDKNELMKRLWPDTFVEDGNLAKHVSLLRKTLSEASNGQEYIETIPKRGYRFIAEVSIPTDSVANLLPSPPSATNLTQVIAAGPERTEKVSERAGGSGYEQGGEILLELRSQEQNRPKRRGRRLSLVVVTFSVLAVAAAAVWFRTRQESSTPEIKLRQLTDSSVEDPIRYGAISPDGKYLAYADLKGIHVMSLKTGESQTVPQTEIFKDSKMDWQFFRWFPDGTRFLVNQNPPPERERGYSATVWVASVLGGVPRKLREDAGVEDVSPDGSMIAFTTDTHNTWLMGPNGEQPRRIYKSDTSVEMFNFRFSPNGKRLLYTEYPDGVVENRDLEGTAPVKVLTGVGDRINDYLWLADGRLVYSMAESTPNQNTCNLWALMVDERTGEPRGTPRRLTNWAGFCAGNLTATADGKQIAFQQWTGHASVYVADLKANGTRITTPTRLTVSDSWNVPSAWAADSKSVVFNSKFNGETRIFQQHLSEDSPHTLVDGMIDFSDHTPLTPDGSWFLIPSKAQSSPDEQWMRVPAIGGVPQPVPGLIMKGGSYGMRCARSPSTLCAIAERPLPTQLTFAAVDPLRGRGRELLTVNVDRESECSWDLSPDGTRLAVLEGLTGQIHVVHLNNQPAQEIRAESMQSTNFVDWTADGKALLVSRPTRRGFELLRVDVNGKSHILWEQRGGLGTSALPSPDGKHLAIRGWSINSNLWLMQDF